MKNALDFLLNFKTNVGGVADKVKKSFPRITQVVGEGSKKTQRSFEELMLASDLAFEQMRQQSKEWAQNFYDDIGSVGEAVQNMNDQFGGFGGQLMQTITSPGMAASAALFKSFEAANDLEKTMQILKRTTNLSGSEMEMLKERIGTLNEEQGVALAQGGHFVASLSEAGFGAQELADNMDVLAEMHHAFGIDTQQITNGLISLKQTVGLSADEFEEYGHKIGVLAKAGKNINPEQMAAGIAQFGEIANATLQGVADKAGKSTKELTMELSEQYARLGETLGGDGAQNFVAQFAEAIGDPQSDAFRGLATAGGEAFMDAFQSGDIQGGMDAVLAGIQSMAENDTLNQLPSQFQKIFGVDSGVAHKILQGKEALASFDEEMARADKNMGTLGDAAHDNMTPWEAFMRQINKFTAALIPLGETIMKIINIFTPLIGVLAEAFNGLMDIVDWIPGGNTALLLLLTSFVGINGVLLALGKSSFKFITYLKNIGTIATKVATGGLNVMMTVIGGIRAGISAIWFVAKKVFTWIGRFLIGAVGGAFGAIMGPILAVIGVLYTIYEVVKMVFGVDLIDEYIKYFTWGWGVLIDTVDAVCTAIYDAFAAVFGWIGDTVGAIGDTIASAWNFLFGDEEKDVTVNYSGGQAPATPLAISGPALDKTSPNLADFGVKQSNETEAEAAQRESIELQRQMVDQLKAGNDDRDAKMGESYARRHNNLPPGVGVR